MSQLEKLIAKLPEKERQEWTEAMEADRKGYGLPKPNEHGLKMLPRDARGNFLPFRGASGKLYHLVDENGIGWERFRQLEEWQMVRAYGVTPHQMVEKINDGVKSFLNPKMIADGTNLMEGVKHFQGLNMRLMDISPRQLHYGLLICALMTRTEGEDMTVYSEDVITAKVEDWKEYAIGDFFLLSAYFVSGLAAFWKKNSEAEQEAMKKLLDGIRSSMKQSTALQETDPLTDGENGESTP